MVCCLFGHSRAEILDRKEFDGGIISNIEEATNYVTRHIDVRYEIKDLRRKEIPEYPLEAYREAIVNAILHRDYFDTSGDVVIEVHRNTLRITNPGGLVKGLDRSNFGKLSRPRNRLMADLLLRTEFVERLGTGITRIRSACETANLPPPEFEFDDYNFLVTISRAEAEIGEVGGAVGVPVNVPINVPVNPRQQWILSRIIESGSIQMKTIRNEFKDLSEKTSKRDIEQLKQQGLIIFVGPPKTGRYVLTEKGKHVLF